MSDQVIGPTHPQASLETRDTRSGAEPLTRVGAVAAKPGSEVPTDSLATRPASSPSGSPTIGLHTMATPELSPEEALDLAARLGLDGVELIYQPDYRCGFAPGTTTVQAKALAQRARALGQQILGLVPYLPDLDVDDEQRRQTAIDEMKRVVELAQAMECRNVRVLAGHDVEPDRRAASHQRLVASLQELAESAEPAGVSLNIENHMDTLATSAAETMAIVSATSRASVGVLYDQANLAILGAEESDIAIELQGADTRHVHVKNFLPRASGREPVALDVGVVDWPTVLERLRNRAYEGCLSLEYERRWFPDVLPPAEIGIPAWRDQLRRWIELWD